jgi:hypothetical protein
MSERDTMPLILQTMITNKVNQDRTMRWAGTRGVFVPGGESVIVEGAYPTACRTTAGLKALEAEIEQGLTSIQLVTNIDVVRPIGKKGAVSNPTAIKEAAKETLVEVVPLTEYKRNTEERFHIVKDGKHSMEPETVGLPGTKDIVIPEPITKAMFPEGVTLYQEGQKTIPVPAPVEFPTEEIINEEAVDTPPIKTRKRKVKDI